MPYDVDNVEAALTEYVEGARIAMTVARASDPNQRLFLVNDPLAKMVGYERHEIIGRNCRFLQGDYRAQPARDEIRAFLANDRKTHLRTQIVNFRKDGSAFVNMLVMVKLYRSAGQPAYYLGTQFDIGAADSETLAANEDAVAADLGTVRDLAEDHRHMMRGSLQSLGHAAAQIAQARMMLSRF